MWKLFQLKLKGFPRPHSQTQGKMTKELKRFALILLTQSCSPAKATLNSFYIPERRQSKYVYPWKRSHAGLRMNNRSLWIKNPPSFTQFFHFRFGTKRVFVGMMHINSLWQVINILWLNGFFFTIDSCTVSLSELYAWILNNLNTFLGLYLWKLTW